MKNFTTKNFKYQNLMMLLAFISFAPLAGAAPSTLDVKKRGEQEIRRVVEPVIDQYFR